MGRVFQKRTNSAGEMAKLSESNTLELRIAFHNAVARFEDWTADVGEPRVKLCGKFCSISVVCEEVANLSDPLPKSILSILYRKTHAGDDALALKIDETYRGAGRHLLRLIAKRKDEIGGGKHCDRNHAQRSSHFMTIDLSRDEIWFLKALRAAGERGRILSAPASRAGLAHLVEVQYITEHPQSERKTLYIITDRGRRALANAPQ
jgi:hypothetical protein